MLKWIPAHSRVAGKWGGWPNQAPDNFEITTSCKQTNILLKCKQQRDWWQQNGGYNPWAVDINKPIRKKTTTIFHLRTEPGSYGNGPMRMWRTKGVSWAHSPGLSIQGSCPSALLIRKRPNTSKFKNPLPTSWRLIYWQPTTLRFKDGDLSVERCRRRRQKLGVGKWRSRGGVTKYFIELSWLWGIIKRGHIHILTLLDPYVLVS